MIAQKGDVQIVAERHQPQAVSEQGGYEPGFADQDTVEEQLNEMQNHEKRKKGAEKEQELLALIGYTFKESFTLDGRQSSNPIRHRFPWCCWLSKGICC